MAGGDLVATHSTHKVQTLDLYFTSSFKTYCGKEFENSLEHGNKIVRKHEIGEGRDWNQFD